MKKYLILLTLFCLSQNVSAQKYFDFEDGGLSSWKQVPAGRWSTSQLYPLDGIRSLYAIAPVPAIADTCRISTLVQPNRAAHADTFRFVFKHTLSSGNISGANRFAMFFAANIGAEGMSFKNKALNAYIVSVTGTSGNDTLRLFHQKNGTLTTLITSKVKAGNKKLGVEIIRSAEAMWSLNVSESGDFASLINQGTKIYNEELAGSYVGFSMIYSTANSTKELWVDNVYANFVYHPQKIISIQRKGARCLQVQLSRSVALERAGDVSLYHLNTVDSTSYAVDSVVVINTNELQIFVNQDFKWDDYVLKIENLPDEYGISSNLTHTFSLDVLRYGDIVFSELMVRPNSESELPEEYIEIFNRTNQDISLAGFTLASPARTGRISAGVVKAKSYAVIGNVPGLINDVHITSRPTLTDAGANLVLKDSYGIPLAVLTYSDSWYADEAKKTGGWSLEKIDVDNLAESAINWRASLDERGGTPLEQNSVAAKNVDVAPPACITFAISDSSITLEFDEAVKGEEVVASSFVLNGCGVAQDVLYTIENPMCITLKFACALEKHKVYRLTADDVICDFSGNCARDFELQLGFGDNPLSGDVVINEVLFNPYAGGVDFVELYNVSERIVELQNLRIANRKSATGAIDRAYVLPAYTLLPNNYVVITTKPDVVREQYTCQNPNAFIALTTLPSYPNESGCVTLLNADSTLLEDFYYTEKMHSGILTSKKGVSLERINPNRPANEDSNWLSGAQTVGFATPTYKNSQHSSHEFSSNDAINIYPETFSPDGDGFDDMLFIGYKMPSEGYIANITIFTPNGKIAKTLCRNATLATEGQLSWDGVCDNGKPADVGIYVVYIEVFSLSGKVSKYKKTCVVGARF